VRLGLFEAETPPTRFPMTIRMWSRDIDIPAGVKDFLSLQLLGSEDTLREQLERLLQTVEVDELMFTVDLYDPEKRRHALDILAATRH